ncbi:hypothetical protein [Flavobacterium sp.]|uniref:hypothetical protein n=1 Tax=Flavobacterium sp. TaxID=239 RepID=UPI002EDAEED7
MENKNNTPVFTFSIVAIILAVALYKQFDFETFKFEQPELAVLYIVVFVFSIYILIKNFIKRSGK